MSVLKKFAGLLAGISAVGAIGVAVAQSVPPNPLITNPPIAAGQQSTHMTPMGETGVLAYADEMIARQPEVAVVAPAPEPAPPAPVAAAPAAPAPAPVAAAPAPEPAPPTTVAMASPEPAAPPMRQDRN